MFKKGLHTIAGASLALALAAGSAAAAGVTIGFLTDMTGASGVHNGESSLPVIQMAIEDAGGTILGEPVKVLSADQLNKPDVALGIAREWVEREGVNFITDVNNSAAALAINDWIRGKNVLFASGASTTKLVGENCSDQHTQWLPNSDVLSKAIVIPLVKQGADKWFMITVDYAFGHDLEEKSIAAIKAAGGEVVGSVRHSPTTTDYSAFLLEAQSKGAKTIGLVTFGSYMVNIIKQVQEFGMDVQLVPYYLTLPDIKAVGLDALKNVSTSVLFYWDRNDKTRAFARRYEERYGRKPTISNAYVYQAVHHYLKAVKAAGTTDAKAVAAKMRELKVEDATDISAYVSEDGRVVRDMYAVKTKTAAESKGDWDYFTITATADKDTIFTPISESKCPYVKK
ncbi:MAG: ABC transporter substrate-binding protein [Flavobacteriaceae bacterium]